MVLRMHGTPIEGRLNLRIQKLMTDRRDRQEEYDLLPDNKEPH